MKSEPADVGWVGSDYRNDVTTQSYESRPRIDGVETLDLRVFSDEGGDFCEIARLDTDGTLAGVPGYRPAQISYSLMEPGTIKAWHLHRWQDDLWFISPGARLLIGLLDVREDSPTYRMVMRFVLGADKAQFLYIPRGVAHGVANFGLRPAAVIYFTNRAFDASDPDEHRLPAGTVGEDFWTVRAG
jgi:dTDP-4-dehydrorhamnose 3,5-epimerase